MHTGLGSPTGHTFPVCGPPEPWTPPASNLVRVASYSFCEDDDDCASDEYCDFDIGECVEHWPPDPDPPTCRWVTYNCGIHCADHDDYGDECLEWRYSCFGAYVCD